MSIYELDVNEKGNKSHASISLYIFMRIIRIKNRSGAGFHLEEFCFWFE